ncbi:predicted protein, partial [Nematostella vectensis]
CKYKTHSRSLRSASQQYLQVKRGNLKTYGDRAFSMRPPKLWNELPFHLRTIQNLNTFKQCLKTHL